jgi:glycosyltransferase involved in cell wall biosynthesis
MPRDTLIVLPAFNEAAHIADVVRAVRTAMPEADIAVVDDGSTDATGVRACESGATVLPLAFNAGYGAALQTGYKFALNRGYDYLVQMDADGQHDPAGIATVLEHVTSGKSDLCIGSRFLEGDTYRIPPLRRAGMILFRRIASWLIGQTITDPTSGFQAMNRRVIEFFARDLYPGDYPDTDILVLLHRNGYRIAERPVIMQPHASGRSMHTGLRPLYYLFKMALDIPLNLIRRKA